MNGYIRNIDITHCIIANDVINLCIEYYHEKREKFKHFNSENYKLSNGDMTICKTGGWMSTSTVYGTICIDSSLSMMHKWILKIKHMDKYSGAIGIGIDETKYFRKDYGSFDYECRKTKLYGIWNDGTRVNSNGVWDNIKYKTGDIIIMELDLLDENKTISFAKNNDVKKIAFEKVLIGENITYCMTVCCLEPGDAIELLSYAIFQ